MMYLSLQAYRVAINTSIIGDATEELIQEASTPEGLTKVLGYEGDVMPEEYRMGLNPQKNTGKLPSYLKEGVKRNKLRAGRIKRGFKDFNERKGIKGWIQKTFFDKKELSCVTEYEVFHWLHHSPRYNLLTTLHDLILNKVSTGEPREISLDEITSFPNPATTMVAHNDLAFAKKLSTALSTPMAKLSPDFLIEGLSGYVHYQRVRGFAYYYTENV
ncbi:MAG: hypothetical protein AAF984_00190 [Verrucomicrobiota bacterium]